MIKCVCDFYCLRGILRFKIGKDYELKNNTIECGNYHLHNPLSYFQFKLIN